MQFRIAKVWAFAGLLAVYSLFGFQATWASEDCPESTPRGGGGGQMPDPLTIFNQHVELANGELYLLDGQIVMAPGLSGASHRLQPYLAVDLSAHPWLAGEKRKQTPMYPLEASASAWTSLEGKSVRLAARAHAQIMFTDSDLPMQVIWLKPMPEFSTIPRH